MVAPPLPSVSKDSSQSSRQQGSSGRSSVDSKNDRWRIGGPGPLPDWPVFEGPATTDISRDLARTVIQVAIQRLEQRRFDFTQVRVCL